ncbi:MAG: methylenetetrahydrofolate reductase C-terminal domain-containing protein [Oscillospiraceae bacterium]|nr:methylenetetrahydrofolate reductase C-terminal domain-containing protein [Oscillospiraceae bacterium]
MLITELKQKDDVLSLIKGKALVISCIGCKEVYFPVTEAEELHKELLAGGNVSAVITTDYICNPENLKLQLKKHMDKVEAAEILLVFSCGVGVQTVAELYPNKAVFAACDTYPLPGHQGITPLEPECDQCAECHLSDTAGICPITACSKGLLNGQCGGSKNGMCEVDKDMECGWERIYRRLEKLGLLDSLLYPAKIRNYIAIAGAGANASES